jgi:hypothetical protein
MIKPLRLLLAALLTVFATGPPSFASGVVADGAVGGGPRADGQLLISNSGTGGHTIVSLEQLLGDDESAIESIGVLANGASRQQGSQFWRWVGGNNAVASFEASWSSHLTSAGADNTPLVLLGRNSVKLCAGATSTLPWQSSLPPMSWVDVRCPQRIAGYLVVGPSLGFGRHPLAGLTVEGLIEAGDASGGFSHRVLQAGYLPDAGAALVQAYNVQDHTFLPLIVAGSDVTVAYPGQRLGFYGAPPTARPQGTCSASDGSCIRMITDALAALGLASIKVVP